MGAQVDPGYKGKLYCTLFNFSDSPIDIRYKDHLATIEFLATTKYKRGDKTYEGPYQNRKDILEEIYRGTYPKSGLKKAYEKMNQLNSRVDKLYAMVWGVLISIVVLLIMIIRKVLGWI